MFYYHDLISLFLYLVFEKGYLNSSIAKRFDLRPESLPKVGKKKDSRVGKGIIWDSAICTML